MNIDSVICNEIVRRLNESNRKECGIIIREYLGILQCSRGALYKELRKYGYDSKKKSRVDKGVRRIQITDDQLRMIAGAIKKSKRKKRRATMPTTVAVEIAAQAGIVPAEMVDKVATVNRLLRQTGMAKNLQMRNWTTDDHAIPAFYTPLVSEHPNEWHLFDVTPCTQYYFNTKGLRQRDENLQLYGGKLKYYKETKEHLLRYVVIDHKTDMFYFRYYYAKGEALPNLVDFLLEAWSPKEDTLYPFQGVPFNLYLDKGSANISHYIQNMCKNLKINLHSHKAGNPRAKGKVEGYMKIIQEQFESRLSLKSATSLEELNKQAYAWMVYYCATKKHRRTRLYRTAFWASCIRTEQLRTIKSKELFLKSVRSKPFIAVVTTAKTIYVDNKEYLIRGNANPGDKASCNRNYLNPTIIYAHKQNEDGTEGDQLSVTLIPKNTLGESAYAARLGKEYKRQEDTITTTEMKAMDKLDYTDMAEAAFKDRRGEIDKLGYIEKEGVPICEETKPEMIMYPRGEVFKEIRFRARIERIAPIQSQWIEQLLGDRETVEDTLIDEIIKTVFRQDRQDDQDNVGAENFQPLQTNKKAEAMA